MVALGGCAWLLWGEACMVPPGGHVWLLWGVCMVALGGSCVVALGGCAWLLPGGMHGCSGGCMVFWGGV